MRVTANNKHRPFSEQNTTVLLIFFCLTYHVGFSEKNYKACKKKSAHTHTHTHTEHKAASEPDSNTTEILEQD
jgi:hypothetical protein